MEKDFILVEEAFYNDRCFKATDRLIQLKKTGERLKEISHGADELDKWNGFGEGYVYVREEIAALSESLKKL